MWIVYYHLVQNNADSDVDTKLDNALHKLGITANDISVIFNRCSVLDT